MLSWGRGWLSAEQRWERLRASSSPGGVKESSATKKCLFILYFPLRRARLSSSGMTTPIKTFSLAFLAQVYGPATKLEL